MNKALAACNTKRQTLDTEVPKSQQQQRNTDTKYVCFVLRKKEKGCKDQRRKTQNKQWDKIYKAVQTVNKRNSTVYRIVEV